MLAHKNLELATGALVTLVPLYGDDLARIVIALRKLFWNGVPNAPEVVSHKYTQEIKDITNYLRLLEAADCNKDLPELPIFSLADNDDLLNSNDPQWAPLQTIKVDDNTEKEYGIDQSVATPCEYDQQIITWPRECVAKDFSIIKP